MKKLILLVFVLVLMSSFVFAQQMQRTVVETYQTNQTVQMMQESPTATGQNQQAEVMPVAVQYQQRSRLMAGDYVAENGQRLQVMQESNNRLRIRVRNVSADTNLSLIQERMQNRTQLSVNFSNGRLANIKIMPDRASEVALARLRLKTCSSENNCTLQLRQVGTGNRTRAAYQINAQQQVKVLGFIRSRMRVQAQVDAETGEVISSQRPWWSFLASQ